MEARQWIEKEFSKRIKSDKILFKRELKPQVILYIWEDCFAYTSPFKCVPSNLKDKDRICACIQKRYPEFKRRSEYYLFAKAIKQQTNESIQIRTLKYQDDAVLTSMKEECDPKEIEIANINIYEGYVIGAFLNHKLVGVACSENHHGFQDLSVLVHPKYRKQKIASSLLSVLGKKAQEEQKTCLYRVDDFNTASYETAIKLGFEKQMDVIFFEWEEL